MTTDSENKGISRRDVFGAIAGAAMAVAATLPGVAHADDAQRDYTAAGWTQELIEFDKASRAATQYAKTRAGVGILIHVGTDVPNQHIESADQLGEAFVQRFAEHGEEARYFLSHMEPSTPDGKLATGVTYHVAHLIVGAHNGTEVRNVKEAWNSVPEAIEQLKISRLLAASDAPAPNEGG